MIDGQRFHPQVSHLLRWAKCVEWQGKALHPTWLLRVCEIGAPWAALPLLQLTIPVNPWPGLYLEVKPLGTRIASEQLARHELLRMAGYRVAVCETADSAAELIRTYLARGRYPIIERGLRPAPRGR
jgi:hypothetical protein